MPARTTPRCWPRLESRSTGLRSCDSSPSGRARSTPSYGRRRPPFGLGARFAFLGHHPDPAAVLAGCDLFTLSSLHEGLSIALLEALALGLPAVVTDVGANGTVVRHGIEGLVVPAADARSLADAYVTLAAAPARRQLLGEAAARRAADFDIAGAAHRFAAIYRAVGEHRSGPGLVLAAPIQPADRHPSATRPRWRRMRRFAAFSPLADDLLPFLGPADDWGKPLPIGEKSHEPQTCPASRPSRSSALPGLGAASGPRRPRRRASSLRRRRTRP